MESEPKTAQLLAEWRGGAVDARNALIARLHPELTVVAAARLRAERGSSLSTGDLINEAVVKFAAADGLSVLDRNHMLALASRIMRNILVDHARAKLSDKRRHQKVEITTRIDGEQRFDLIALDSALIRLKVLDDQLAELVEMRYFGGMTVSDVAAVTGLSEATVKRRWQVARSWLVDALNNPFGDD
ncbi:MAG: ECF-type sigma factor [Hyphomonadaceae bacterium]|nr:ECF-type sigma factor [Hyphomonadaceae bacterium]